MTTISRSMKYLVPGLVIFVAMSCAGKHKTTVVQDPTPAVIGCRQCYDWASKFRRDVDDRLPWPGSGSGMSHMCTGCMAHIELYTLDGKPMIRCPVCAPAGEACNRCVPPDVSTTDEPDDRDGS